MLKTRVGDHWWLVQQPDHARVAGYLAAHWGNDNGFARPGRFAPATAPDLLGQEVIQAIAEHDNGWWEWEASPAFDATDGLPLHLPEVARERSDAGLERWRVGVPRFAGTHPYVALMISMHAYLLYAFAYDDLPDLDDALRHPLFGHGPAVHQLVADRDLTRAFLDEQRKVQDELKAILRDGLTLSAGVEPAHLSPHVRLLQTLDAMSLLISMGDDRVHQFADIPRKGWLDRIAMTWTPREIHRIELDPFPFDTDPLPVYLPLRIIPEPAGNVDLPLVRLHSSPIKTIPFEFQSRR